MEKQLSFARVRRHAEYNGLQSSATSDVCFLRTMGLAFCTVWELRSTFMYTLVHTRVLSAWLLVSKAKMCFRSFAEISSRRLKQGCPVFVWLSWSAPLRDLLSYYT